MNNVLKDFTSFGFFENLVIKTMRIEDVKNKSLDNYNVFLPKEIIFSTPKRQYEFVAGRLCAVHASKNLINQPIFIERDRFGRPVWPNDLVGSISHTEELAIAAVADKKSYSAVGIDCEKFESNNKEILQAIKREAICEEEYFLLNSEIDFYLIFSLKEALYKCLSHSSNRAIDFTNFNVQFIDKRQNRAIIKVIKDYNVNCFQAFFNIDMANQHLYTLVLSLN